MYVGRSLIYALAKLRRKNGFFTFLVEIESPI